MQTKRRCNWARNRSSCGASSIGQQLATGASFSSPSAKSGSGIWTICRGDCFVRSPTCIDLSQPASPRDAATPALPGPRRAPAFRVSAAATSRRCDAPCASSRSHGCRLATPISDGHCTVCGRNGRTGSTASQEAEDPQAAWWTVLPRSGLDQHAPGM
jgi:hypothetical protein